MKKLPTFIFLLLFLISLSPKVFPKTIHFKSQSTQTTLLELYTSEGCSSCPPAEKWLQGFRNSEDLWKKVVPLAFHVDYWDYLGWKDKFAKREFTKRQRKYASILGMQSVYTPGFFVNGEEWRGWFRRSGLPTNSKKEVGILEIKTQGQESFEISFQPTSSDSKHWKSYFALLGLDIASKIKSGENSGKNLTHDFVVLSLQEKQLIEETKHYTATFRLASEFDLKNRKYAVACWVTENKSLIPIQAVGGNLN